MLPYSHLKGLPAFTLNQGHRIGHLDEMLIDAGRRTVRWLRLKGRGWFARPEWVSAPDIHGVGTDAVVLTHENALTEEMEAQEDTRLLHTREDLLGKPVITERGQQLGEVRDYEVDLQGLALTSLLIAPRFNLMGQLEKLPIDRVLTLGHDAVMVSEADAPQPLAVAEAEQGEHLDSGE